MSQNQAKIKFSKMVLFLPSTFCFLHQLFVFDINFLFLTSTLDCKEGIQQYNDNVNLHPIDVNYE